MTTKRRALIGTALVAVIAMTGACGDDATSSQPPAGTATAIVYADAGDLFVYDASSDAVERLTEDGEQRREVSPQFRDAETVTFAIGSSILEAHLARREPREIFEAPGDVTALAWSPDRTSLAYLYSRDEYGTALTLSLLDVRSRKARRLRDFPAWVGRGGHDGDEVAIRWSPDGSKLSVVLTPLDSASKQTMFVLRPDGSDVVRPLFGTMARWAAPDRLYYRQYDGAQQWFAIDDAGRAAPVGIRKGAVRPALSPDGRRIAYDTGGASPTIYVYDLETNEERRLVSGRVAPVWLAADTLAATDVARCGDCDGDWLSRGTTSRISVDDGATSRLTLATTLRDPGIVYA